MVLPTVKLGYLLPIGHWGGVCWGGANRFLVADWPVDAGYEFVGFFEQKETEATEPAADETRPLRLLCFLL